MFVHDLCHSYFEYLKKTIDFMEKDRAKRYDKSSIFNSGYARLGIFISNGKPTT
jgi:hypothetical protein